MTIKEIIDEPIIGIDLGTTNSCIAHFNKIKKKIELIPLINDSPLYPSKVIFEDNSEIYNVKRFIGKTEFDDFIEREILFLPYKVSFSGELISITNTKGKSFLPEELSSMVLSDMKLQAEKFLGRKIKNIVITVPAHFNDNQKKATLTACSISGLNVIGLLSEPTAAALSYCLSHEYENINDEKKKILVFDLGGGTLDISLLETNGKEYFEVINTLGNVNLGGEDFTNEVMIWCLTEFINSNNLDNSVLEEIVKNKKNIRKLRDYVENAKKSFPTKSIIKIEYFHEKLEMNIEISELLFNNICSELFSKCIRLITNILDYATINKSEIEDIILVGGASRMSYLRKLISDYFEDVNNKKLKFNINPDEAIAYGAAVYSAILNGYSNYLRNIIVHDVTPLTISIKTSGNVYIPLIEKNSKIPCIGNKIFKTVSNSQTSALIQIYQESDLEYFKLGECRLENIIGETKLEITISVDRNNILCAKIKNLSNNEILKTKFNNLVINNIKN